MTKGRLTLQLLASLFLVTACSAESRPPVPPEMSFSTYVGGEAWDAVRDVAIDASGNIYLAGGTRSKRPVFGHGEKTTTGDSNDAFVAKLHPEHGLQWAVVLGGPGYDQAYAIEVAADGSVVVGGRGGVDFPTTPGVAQPFFEGGPVPVSGQWYGTQDGVVFKLSPEGELVWATYAGGPADNDFLRDVALAPDGTVYLGSAASEKRYPEALADAFDRGAHPAHAGGKRDAVLIALSADGRKFEWANFVGGSGHEWAEVSVASDAEGNAYLLTLTNSTDAPVLSAVQPHNAGSFDFYLTKFSPSGEPLFATYLGGSDTEHIETHHLAIAGDGSVLLAAGTHSTDYPVTADAYQPRFAGLGGAGTGRQSNYSGDAVVSRISTDGGKLLASTYLGGSAGEAAEGVAVDAAGRAFFVGATYSQDFPTFPPVPIVAVGDRSNDAFAAVLSPGLDRLLGSVRIGETGGQALRAAAVSRDGRQLAVGGTTNGDDWPTRRAFAEHFAGSEDGVLALLTFPGIEEGGAAEHTDEDPAPEK